MEISRPLLLVLLTVALTAGHCNARCTPDDEPLIRSVAEPAGQIHFLRPKSGSAGEKVPQINCLSWRLAVETNNLQDWSLVPQNCKDYVGHYMEGKKYRRDCEVVADEAIKYAKGLKLTGTGKEVWVFDVDETTLSNLPYYARSDVQFGALPYNGTTFDEWVATGTAPPIPASLRLYKELLALGIKPVFLTGSRVRYTSVRAVNLNNAGYFNWEKFILKGNDDKRSAVQYKSSERDKLVEAGYIIVGNMGDQWSDLIGTNVGARTFKVPDPLYFIA